MIPKQQEPVVDKNGHATPNWYRYLRSLARQAVADVATPDLQALWGSIIGYGLLVRNSVGAPVFRKLKGVSGNTVVTNEDGTWGDPTIDLAPVTDAGGGTLQKTDIDGFGRVIGTSAATTTDLPEGTNLYFTGERAIAAAGQSTVPTYLASGETFTVLADKQALYSIPIEVDGVMEIDGALVEVDEDALTQTEADALYAATSRTISTTAPLTGGGDLSANRTLAISAATTGAAGSMSAADKTKLDGVAAGATAYTDALARLAVEGEMQGYIGGLKMVWVSATAVTVTSGAAYIPSLAKILPANSDIALTGLSLAASTWHHLYLYSNAGTPAIECVTTAPVVYNGVARQKTGDNSRRYVGSVLTDASGNIYNIGHVGDSVFMLCSTGSGTPFRVLSGNATAITSVSCANCVPASARVILVKLAAPTGAVLRATISEATGTTGPPSVASMFAVNPQAEQYVMVRLATDLSFQYWCDTGTPTTNAGAFVYGYIYER